MKTLLKSKILARTLVIVIMVMGLLYITNDSQFISTAAARPCVALNVEQLVPEPVLITVFNTSAIAGQYVILTVNRINRLETIGLNQPPQNIITCE